MDSSGSRSPSPRRGCSRRPSGWERCWPLSNRRVEGLPDGRAWLITAAIHLLAVVLFFTVSWEAPARHASYLVLQPEPAGEPIVFLPGTRESRATGGAAVVATRREPAHPAAASTPPPPAAARPPEVPLAAAAAAVSAAELARRDSSVTRATDTPVAQRDTSVMLPFNPDASRVAPAPQVGDGRLWVTPRPALPASV